MSDRATENWGSPWRPRFPRKRPRRRPLDTARGGTSWDVLAPSTQCVECMSVVVGVLFGAGVGVRPHEVHPGPRCQTASDGAAVKGAASAVREAQAEGPTLTGATPMRPSCESGRDRRGVRSRDGRRGVGRSVGIARVACRHRALHGVDQRAIRIRLRSRRFDEPAGGSATGSRALTRFFVRRIA